MTVTLPDREERRKSLQPFDVGGYNPGLRRIIEQAITDLRLHDERFSTYDRVSWQSAYSLLNHHAQVRAVMATLGKAWRRTERDILIGEIAAQLHDIGKLDVECNLYRANRRLSTEEKSAVDTHATHSGEYINHLKTRVRPEDYPTIEEIRIVASSHHEPEVIDNPRLRRIGIDVHLSDIFVSCQEDRHRARLGQSQALDVLHETVETKLDQPEYEHCQHEFIASMVMITQLYGINLKRIEEELKPGA